jgi:hypothetical protein
METGDLIVEVPEAHVDRFRAMVGQLQEAWGLAGFDETVMHAVEVAVEGLDR